MHVHAAGMACGVPLEGMDQGCSAGRRSQTRMHLGRSFDRRAGSPRSSGSTAKGPQQIARRFCFGDPFHRQPHPVARLHPSQEFHTGQAVEPEIAIQATVEADLDAALRTRMQFFDQLTQDDEHQVGRGLVRGGSLGSLLAQLRSLVFAVRPCLRTPALRSEGGVRPPPTMQDHNVRDMVTATCTPRIVAARLLLRTRLARQ